MGLKLTNSKLRVGTFFGCLQLSALSDLDRLRGLVSHAFGHVLDLGYSIHTLQNLSKDDVLSIQPSAQAC